MTAFGVANNLAVVPSINYFGLVKIKISIVMFFNSSGWTAENLVLSNLTKKLFFYIALLAKARVIQWQNASFPSLTSRVQSPSLAPIHDKPYSLILYNKARWLISKSFAAWVRLPFVCSKALRINAFSISVVCCLIDRFLEFSTMIC